MHPILLQFGSLAIRSYGVLLVVAFIVSFYLAKHDSERIDLSKKSIDSAANYLLLTGLIGARLYYGILYDPYYYLTKPWTLLFIWQGGLAVHGAIIGGLFGLYLFSKRKGFSFLKMADFFAPFLLLGQSIGRIGCLLNGCCYGLPTERAWGIIFAKDSDAFYHYGFQALHPTQLYESILALLGFIVFWLIRRDISSRGALFSLYLIYYGLIRFIISFLRADSLYIWDSGIKAAHLLSALFVISGITILVKAVLRSRIK